SMLRSRDRVDAYTLELQNHGLDRAEREVRWLNELITNERKKAESAQQPRDFTT
ncbi:MAG: PadR family transcriptional regulator, partial [Actinomycetota bacterium]|nr:PadR family transcriptional regulator [Actinomycetota bacterium]